MVEIRIYLSLTTENGQISLFALLSVSINHLLLGQYLRPSLKGSWHQPTNTTPVSPGAQNACRDGDSVEQRNIDASESKSKKQTNYVVPQNLFTYLARWDIVRHSL